MYVYVFEEGSTKLRSLLGGKGADLAEMTALGLPVPPGLTVTTEACNYYSSHVSKFPPGLEQEIANRRMHATKPPKQKKTSDRSTGQLNVRN